MGGQARPIGGRRGRVEAGEAVWRQAIPCGGRRDFGEALAGETVGRQGTVWRHWQQWQARPWEGRRDNAEAGKNV